MAWSLIAVFGTSPQVARAMGERVAGLPSREAAEAAVEAVRRLSHDVGIPDRLRDVGVTREGIPRMAEDAMKSGKILVNPPATAYQDIVPLFEPAHRRVRAVEQS